MNLSLSSQIDLMPESYGVYMMKDASNKIIYVGKAKNIRKRVKSYFRNSTQNENHKIQLLVNKIHDIDYLVTENESEALILEANLIREKKIASHTISKIKRKFFVQKTIKNRVVIKYSYCIGKKPLS